MAGKRGRPSLYTPELAERICARLAEGESLRSICRDADMPDESSVRQWAYQNYEGFYPLYADARDKGLDVRADNVLDIAAVGSGDVARDRLNFDAHRWYLSKLAPKRYGDRLTMQGDDEAPIVAEVRVKFSD